MFNLDKFIADSVTFRPSSMFESDIKANSEKLTQEIKGKKVCVIGGAGKERGDGYLFHYNMRKERKSISRLFGDFKIDGNGCHRM